MKHIHIRSNRIASDRLYAFQSETGAFLLTELTLFKFLKSQGKIQEPVCFLSELSNLLIKLVSPCHRWNFRVFRMNKSILAFF